jgi:type I protein arginine methyltransferase
LEDAMYSLNAYGQMIKDTLRMEAYQEAIRRTVRPGSIVLDIGTGPGIHALMAAREGADHVYAVEPADSILLGPAIARANGLEDRITFIQDLTTRIDLPRRADVVVSDLHGTLPWYQSHIPTIVDARERLMTPEAVLIPQRDTVFMVAVEAPELYAGYSEPWRERPFGFDVASVASYTTSWFRRGRVGRDGFLSEVHTIAELDYRTIVDPNVHVSLEFVPTRQGVMHGVLAWFETQLFEDVRLTSAPFEPEIAYGSAFFPLTEPVSVEPSLSVELEWRAVLQGDEYVWIWNTDVKEEDGTRRASFRQNSLAAQLVSFDRLRKRAPEYQPTLSAEGETDRSILELMTGALTLEEIARKLRAEAPDAFKSESEALERVRQLSERYG